MVPPKKDNKEDTTTHNIASLYHKTSESVRDLVRVVGQFEQKIAILTNQQDTLFTKFEKLLDLYNTLLQRITSVEAKDIGSIILNIDANKQKLILLESEYKHFKEKVSNLESISDYLKLKENENKDVKKNLDSLSENVQQIKFKIENLHSFKEGTDKKFQNMWDFLIKIAIGVALGGISAWFGYLFNGIQNKN